MRSNGAEGMKTSPFLHVRVANSISIPNGKEQKNCVPESKPGVEGRLLELNNSPIRSRNGLRGGFANRIAQRAEGRLLQWTVNFDRCNNAILIELFWNSQAQSSYEIEWVESVRRKPKLEWDKMQDTASCKDHTKNFEENTKNIS